MRSEPMSPRVLNRMMWFGALVLVAGAVTFGVVMLGNKDESAPRASAPVAAADDSVSAAAAPVETVARGKAVPLSREARKTAGEFILSTVTREDLAKGWTLIHPQMKAECDCSRAEWMTGNIPVQVYPGDALDDASFAIEESYENEAMLQVALLPKDGSDVESQIFWLGLKKVGDGSAKRWLVYYFQPYVITPIPVADG